MKISFTTYRTVGYLRWVVTQISPVPYLQRIPLEFDCNVWSFGAVINFQTVSSQNNMYCSRQIGRSQTLDLDDFPARAKRPKTPYIRCSGRDQYSPLSCDHKRMTLAAQNATKAAALEPLRELLGDVLARIEALETKVGVSPPAHTLAGGGSSSASAVTAKSSPTAVAGMYRTIYLKHEKIRENI